MASWSNKRSQCLLVGCAVGTGLCVVGWWFWRSTSWVFVHITVLIACSLAERLWRRRTQRSIRLKKISTLAANCVPRCAPILSIQDLLDWTPKARESNPLCRSSRPLQFRTPSDVRVMLCHDLRSNYLDDAFVQGTGNDKFYQVWDWPYVDVFVYFSHDRLAVPPVGWINAAHKHGVKVLGTFLFEWEEGKAECLEFLGKKDETEQVIAKLVEVALYFGFEGWLLNFEVKLDQSIIPALEDFCGNLTEAMQSAVPGGLVIWYDAITVDGKLEWQNCLDEKNQPFFNNTSGMLVNYTWTADTLPANIANCHNSPEKLYMGIDVWGRNTKEYGTGVDCVRGVRLSVNSGLSVCLFAPAYAFQNFRIYEWQERDDCMWDGISSVTYKHPTTSTFPFVSTFDRGCGTALFIDGWKISDSSWFNMSCQSMQPIRQPPSSGSKDLAGALGSSSLTTRLTHSVAYNGGSSLVVSGTIQGGEVVWCPLFDTEIPVPDNPMTVSITQMCQGASMAQLVVVMCPLLPTFPENIMSTVESKIFVFEPSNLPRDESPTSEVVASLVRPGSEMEYIVDNKGHGPGRRTVPEALRDSNAANSQWSVYEYTMNGVENWKIVQIGVMCFVRGATSTEKRTFEMTVGEIKVVPANPLAPVSVTNLTARDTTVVDINGLEAKRREGNAEYFLNTKLSWSTDPEANTLKPIDHFNIWYSIEGGAFTFLGKAFLNEYWISGLELLVGDAQLNVKIQSVSTSGVKEEFDNAPILGLSLVPTCTGDDLEQGSGLLDPLLDAS